MWPEMNQVLNELELVSTVSAPNPSPSGGGKPGSRVLSMTEVPPRDFWLDRWLRAESDRKRREVLQGARDELEGLRRRTVEVRETSESEYDRAKRIKACDGWTPREVQANIRGGVVTAKEVRERRYLRGVDPVTGYALKASHTMTERLLEAGASTREVQALTGVNREKARRINLHRK